MLTLQADVSGTIVKWLVENGAQITPGQVSLICSAHCIKNVSEHDFSVHGLLCTMQAVLLSSLRWLSACQLDLEDGSHVIMLTLNMYTGAVGHQAISQLDFICIMRSMCTNSLLHCFKHVIALQQHPSCSVA